MVTTKENCKAVLRFQLDNTIRSLQSLTQRLILLLYSSKFDFPNMSELAKKKKTWLILLLQTDSRNTKISSLNAQTKLFDAQVS